MREYVYKVMAELAGELGAGLLRLRKDYVDAAETLGRIIDPGREYPYDFVVYRLTGYRPPAAEGDSQSMIGGKLRLDLMQLMLDVCDSFELQTTDYDEKVYDTPGLARQYHVSTKTVQRWRRRGLAARRLVFPDGKRRVAFLDSSVQRFVGQQQSQVMRSMRFTQLTETERKDIIHRAKRMAAFTHCTLSDVAKRLATRTGRAVETIRYTIRNHDAESPDDAVFPYLSGPLSDQEKKAIYRCFLRGVPVSTLTERYRRTRGTIYRVINEMRAQQLLSRPILYVYNPQFDLPGADELMLAPTPAKVDAGGETKTKLVPKPPADLPPYLRALYDVPLLPRDKERDVFRRYNYLKYKGDKLRREIDMNRIRTRVLKEIETLLLQANVVKNQIIRANLRLVVSIAKKHVGGAQTMFELISDGNVSLMRAAEKFDYSRGNRFSTYASWAIIRNFARSVPKERYQLDRFATGHDEILDIAASLRTYDPNEVNLAELRESIDVVLTRLTPQERLILVGHYGLDDSGETKTLEQLGKGLGISKERVRQIELQAMGKLRVLLQPEKAGLMT